MRVEVRGKGLEVTAALRAFVESRARLALGSRAEQVRRLLVWVEDVNGPKGGTDKVCRVKVSGPDIGEHVVESASAEVGSAVFEAVDRAARLATRAMKRVRERRLAGPARPWALGYQG